jgi:hypothetical protein
MTLEEAKRVQNYLGWELDIKNPIEPTSGIRFLWRNSKYLFVGWFKCSLKGNSNPKSVATKLELIFDLALQATLLNADYEFKLQKTEKIDWTILNKSWMVEWLCKLKQKESYV